MIPRVWQHSALTDFIEPGRQQRRRNMTRKSLDLMGAAVIALMVGSPGAFAQVAVTQSSLNNNAVTNTGTIGTGAGDLGLGGSVAVTASGALSSTSATAINQSFNTHTLR